MYAFYACVDSVLETIHEHEKSLPKADGTVVIENFNSTIIQKVIRVCDLIHFQNYIAMR